MNPQNYAVASAQELRELLAEGLLTKAEARAIVLDSYPSAKRIADAQRLISESEGD